MAPPRTARAGIVALCPEGGSIADAQFKKLPHVSPSHPNEPSLVGDPDAGERGAPGCPIMSHVILSEPGSPAKAAFAIAGVGKRRIHVLQTKYIDSSFAALAQNDTSKDYCANFRDAILCRSR